jgi:ELWxxDGT repeat protein
MVKDIGSLSNPQNLAVFNGFTYFFAQDDTHGYELWRSDGTFGGTNLFININTTPGSPGTDNGSGPGGPMAISGGKLYFLAGDGVRGLELWVTDGIDNTTAHTHIVKDIVGGSTSSFVGNTFPHLTDVNGTLYFTINDNTASGLLSLYKTDGTDSGTLPVATHIYYPGFGINPFGFVTTGTPFMNFDTDVSSDLLWRSSSGVNAVWDMNGNGTIKNALNVQSVDASYKLAGTGDFDGDGITDLLWRNTSGVNALWEMNSHGTIKNAFNDNPWAPTIIWLGWGTLTATARMVICCGVTTAAASTRSGT